MVQILGKINDDYYTLTFDGKKELINEVNRRRFYHQEKTYDDNNFSAILEFIVRNFDNTIYNALAENVRPDLIPLDRHVRIANNRKKLEAWFEAVASSCNMDDLTGNDILTYFCSEEYQKGIADSGFVSTIEGMTEVLRRNIGIENTEFLDKVRGSNSRPIKR